MLEEGIHSSLQAEKSEDGDGASPGWHMLAQVHDMFLQQMQGEHGGMIRRYFRRFFYKYWLTRQNLWTVLCTIDQIHSILSLDARSRTKVMSLGEPFRFAWLSTHLSCNAKTLLWTRGQQMQNDQGGVVNSTLVATMIREDVSFPNLQIAIYSDLKLSSFFIANK